MLTIQNVRTDIGTTIGDYTLSDGGLSSPISNGDSDYYSFYWKNNLNRTFKFLLDRVPVDGKQTIYRLRFYDGNRAIVGTNKDGFVVETKVRRNLLKSKVDFYGFMIKIIEQYKYK